MKESKKIGLVAVSNHNYGSQLQTFALQQALTNLGVETEIIKYKQNPWKQLKRVTNPSFLLMKEKSIARNIVCKLKYTDIAKGLKTRAKIFEEFKSSHCQYSPLISERSALKQYVMDYKAVILGSDQVWHPANLEMDYFTLSFVPDSIPKIAYAPSFGVAKIPNRQVEKTKAYLSRFDAISVREDTGANIVNQLTGKTAPVVCDPTALLTKSQWDRVRSKKTYVNDKYIFCYFLGTNRAHRDFAKKIQALTGYKIVALQHLDELVKEDIAFGDIKPYNVGPQDFVTCIANAEIVLTDSFHGTMFSIYYHKNFYTFSRFTEGEKDSTNMRITSILNTLGLNDRHYTTTENPESCLVNNVEWNNVDEKLSQFRQASLDYLNAVVQKYNLKSVNKGEKSIASKKKDLCTGCTACVYVCPKECITMRSDHEGFLYPAVDSTKCIQCGICSKVCPVNNKNEQLEGKAFAARNEDISVRMTSSSGGMFNAIATWVINHNGVVAGAKFNEHMQVHHVLIDNLKDLKPLQASKYVQSDLRDVFSEIKRILLEDRYVFFCGTPCQAAGLKHYLKRDYDNLFVADVICYGVPSPGIFNKFVKYMEDKHQSPMREFYFRDKTYGYASPNLKAIFENGSIEQMTSDVKSFTKTFFAGVTTRPSCFNCAFKSSSRETDFTLGDFWTVSNVDRHMDDDTGATLLFVHSEKGINIIEQLDGITLKEIDYGEAVRNAGPMLLHSAKPNIKRDAFFANIDKIGYKRCVARYVPDSVKSKLANIVKPILLKTNITQTGILKIVKKYKMKKGD